MSKDLELCPFCGECLKRIHTEANPAESYWWMHPIKEGCPISAISWPDRQVNRDAWNRRAEVPTIKEGFRLVPVEPTLAQRTAGYQAAAKARYQDPCGKTEYDRVPREVY